MTTNPSTQLPEIDEILEKFRSATWNHGWNGDALIEAKLAIQKLIDEACREARKKAASDIFNLAHKYATEDKTMRGSEELRSYHYYHAIAYYNAIAKIGEFDGR